MSLSDVVQSLLAERGSLQKRLNKAIELLDLARISLAVIPPTDVTLIKLINEFLTKTSEGDIL